MHSAIPQKIIWTLMLLMLYKTGITRVWVSSPHTFCVADRKRNIFTFFLTDNILLTAHCVRAIFFESNTKRKSRKRKFLKKVHL